MGWKTLKRSGQSRLSNNAVYLSLQRTPFTPLIKKKKCRLRWHCHSNSSWKHLHWLDSFGFSWCGLIFKSFHRYSLGFKSGMQGCWRTFTFLLRGHSNIDLAACLSPVGGEICWTPFSGLWHSETRSPRDLPVFGSLHCSPGPLAKSHSPPWPSLKLHDRASR